MKRVFAYIILTAGILVATPGVASEKKPRIATTQAFTQEWVQIIAGETVTSDLLEHHHPSEQPLELLIETGLEREQPKLNCNTPRVVLSDGLPLLKEGQSLQAKICKRSAKKGEATACCCKTNTPTPHYEAIFDPALARASTHPYAWMDVSIAISMIVSLTETLCDLSPEHALLYKERSKAYQKELKALDLQIFKHIKNLPSSRRKEPNSSWLYFTRRYGLEPGKPEKTTPLYKPSIKAKTYIETMQLHVESLKKKGSES